MLTRIASHGFVAVGIWKEESPLNSFNVTWMNDVIDFVENRLETNLHVQGFNIRMHVDYLHSFIGSHSAGGHVPVAILEVSFNQYLLIAPFIIDFLNFRRTV